MSNLKYMIILSIFIFIIISVFSSTSFATRANLTMNDTKCYYSEEFTVITQLLDENNNPLNNAKIQIAIDSENFNSTYTDYDGKVKLNILHDLDGFWYETGIHKITATYLGKDNNPTLTESKLIILKMPFSLKSFYDESEKKFVSLLIDKNGNPIGSGRLDLYINGKFYEYSISDEYGKTYHYISHLKPGKYKIDINNYYYAMHNYIKAGVQTEIIIEENDTSLNIKHAETNSIVMMKNTGFPVIGLVLSIIVLISNFMIVGKKE